MTSEDENTEPIPVIPPEPEPRRSSGVVSAVVTGIMLILTTVLLCFSLKPLGSLEVAALCIGVLAAFLCLLFLSFAVTYLLYEVGQLIRWILRYRKPRGRHSFR